MSMLSAVAFFNDGPESSSPPRRRMTEPPLRSRPANVPRPPKPVKLPKQPKAKQSKSRVSRQESIRQLDSQIGDLENHVPSVPSSIIDGYEPEPRTRATTYSGLDEESVGPRKRTFSPWAHFEYAELPPNHIRLLRFKHAPFYSPWGVAFDLITVPLDALPAYEALSYRWEGGNEKVSCGGGTLLVSANCKAALKRLNNKDNTLLWVDAICINQHDGLEKNHQVALMSRIYSQAERTIAWLGEDNDLGASCLTLINETLSYLDDFDSFEDFITCGVARENSIVAMLKNDALGPSRAFSKLLRRDWFSRIWILQEVALAKGVIVKCGSQTTTWSGLIAVLRRLKNNNKFAADYRAALNLDTFRKDYQRQGHQRGVDIHAAMVQSRQCDTSDLRDKVYALLGVCPDLAYAMGEPDYKLSAAVVWTRAQKACFSGQLSINALSLVSVGQRLEENVPSWVPDLSTGLKTWPRRPPVPAPTDGVTTIISCSADDPECLHVRGVFVDTLVSPFEYAESKTFEDINVQWRKWWTRFQELDTNIGLKTDKVLSFWTTLFCDNKNTMPNTGMLTSWHTRVLSSSPLSADSLSPNSKAFRDIKASDFVETTLERIFGMTQHAIGLFPKNAQVGDKVVLFDGGTTPYLIRPAYDRLGAHDQSRKVCSRRIGDGYELVGPCYVYGLADPVTRAAKHLQESQEIIIF